MITARDSGRGQMKIQVVKNGGDALFMIEQSDTSKVSALVAPSYVVQRCPRQQRATPAVISGTKHDTCFHSLV